MKKLLLIICLILFCDIAEAATLYVNSSGSDDSDAYTRAQIIAGAGSKQWTTLGRALWGHTNEASANASEAAQAGDTVLVYAGTYSAPGTGRAYGPAFDPYNTGTSDSARIIIQAVGTVNLTTTGGQMGPVIGAEGKNYITWDGFSIDETSYTYLPGTGELSMVMVRSSDYVIIKNCILKGGTTTEPNINHAGIFFHDSSYGRAYNNTIYNIGGADNNVAGIYTYTTTNTTFDHNEIYNSRGGIFIKAGDNDSITVKYNKIHDLSAGGIHLAANTGANTNILVYQNLLYNLGLDGIMSWGNGALGVSTGCKAVNNTIYNVRAGFIFNRETTQVLFYNNIVHTVSQGYAYSEAYAPTNYPTVHAWEHNLYYSSTTKPAWKHEGGSTLTWAQWQGVGYVHDTVSPAGVFGSDPLFVSIPSLNFKLQGGSPAAALGVDILDLDGDGSTTDNIPAGAYITGTETIGIESSDTTPPTVTITDPTSSPTYSTATTPITLSGTASDAVGVSYVSYGNNRGGSGTCTGTTSWSCTGIVLYSGVNIVTVAAYDAATNSGTDIITVTYTIPDTTIPVVTSFVIPSTASSRTVSITSFTATDDVGVTGYCVSETNNGPSCSPYAGSPQSSFTFSSDGAKTLYGFARDVSNNYSVGVSDAVLVDTLGPTVTAFVIPATSNSLTVAISTFTATDANGVTGYCVSETNVGSSCTPWAGTAQTSFIFSSQGTRTLYGFARDAMLNISSSLNDSVVITIPPTAPVGVRIGN